MIRVKPNRCGYSGWACVGIPELDPVVVGEGLTCDPAFLPSGIASIDNYLNLPGQARGFVMTEHVIDMSNPNLPVAEIECYDFRDNSTGVFLDLYGRFYSGYPLDHATVAAGGQPVYKQLSAGYVCFPDGSTLEPGWLEPMINAELPDIGVDGLPAWGFGIDGLIVSLIGFMRWRQYIDDIIGTLSRLNFSALIGRLLENAPCGGLRIEHSGSLLRWGNTSGSPSFSVEGGSITLNGTSVRVSGTGPFTVGPGASVLVYVEIPMEGKELSEDEEDAGELVIKNASVKYVSGRPSRSANKAYIELGTIQQINLPRKGKTPPCRVWKISQTNCDIDTDMVRVSKSGVLWHGGSGSSSMPYKALDTGDCDDESSSSIV